VSETVPPVSRLLDLTGRVALVTEASGGVGSGIAQETAYENRPATADDDTLIVIARR
jgi:NAD(P)-dependent dehydrogenase (short-subunit alcohol dehydrogenase family)